MKSDEIIRWYAHANEPAPPEGWKRLLWMAAELVKRAQIERRAFRPLRGKRKKEASDEQVCDQRPDPVRDGRGPGEVPGEFGNAPSHEDANRKGGE